LKIPERMVLLMNKNIKKLIIVVVILALIAGGIFAGLTILKKNTQKPVKVYKLSEMESMGYIDYQGDLSGLVQNDLFQKIYPDDSKVIKEIYVKEGAQIKVGDKILSYDTTLTEIQIERKNIEIQEFKLNITKLNKDLTDTKDNIVKLQQKIKDTESSLKLAEAEYKNLINEETTVNTEEYDLTDDVSDEILNDSVLTKIEEKNNQINEYKVNLEGFKTELLENNDKLTQLPQKIKEAETDKKIAELEYSDMKKGLDNSTVFSKVEGIVKKVNTDNISDTSTEIISISGNGSLKIKAVVTEYQLDDIKVGDMFNIMSYESQISAEGTVESIGTTPESAEYWGGDSNNNVSFYPIYISVDENAGLIKDEGVMLQKISTDVEMMKLTLPRMFILSENGKSFVYAKGKDGLLEKKEIKIGKSMDDSSLEIRSGLTKKDAVAFPYGKTVKEGAKTVISKVENLYK